MPTNLLARLSETKSLLGKIWYLTKPYWFTRDIAEVSRVALRLPHA